MAIFQFGWGDNKYPSEETGTDQSDSLTLGSTDSLESILNVLGTRGKGKRKHKGEQEPQDPDKRQKSLRENQLEWLIKNAIEKAIQPLREELAQLKRILQDKEQEEKKQEAQGQRKTTKAQSQAPHPTGPATRTKTEDTANAGFTLSYSQAVKRGPPGPSTQNGWTTVQNKKKAKKTKPEQRRILFQLDKKPDANAQDLLLKVNQALRQEKAEGISFHQLNVTRTGQISGLLNEHSSREALEPYLTKVVQVLENSGVKVQQAGAPQTWTKLKVHTVPLQRYYREGGQDLVKDEIEATLGLQLPVGVRWLRSASKIQQAQEEGAQYSSIVITVPNENVANQLRSQGIYFGGRRHMAETYHDSAKEVCPRCCRASHQGECENPPVCFICGESHLRKDHECRVCKSRNPCKHNQLKCANCGGKHEAVSRSCPSIQRAQRQGREKQKEPPKETTTGVPSSPPPGPIVVQSSSPSTWSMLPSSPLMRRSQQVMNLKPDAPTRVETSPPREGPSQDKEMEDILSEIVLDQGEDNEL